MVVLYFSCNFDMVVQGGKPCRLSESFKTLILPSILFFLLVQICFSAPQRVFNFHHHTFKLQNFHLVHLKKIYLKFPLTFSHNHIKITTKIQNNHHSEPSEIELNGSLTTTELKKPHISRLIEGVHTWNGLVPHPHEVDKNLVRISQEWEVVAPHQEPQPRVPVAGW